MTNYNSGYSPITQFLPPSINYGKVGELAIKDYMAQQGTAMAADGLVDKTEIEADARTKIAKYEAEAIKARGAAAGKAAMWKGIGSAVGSVGSAFAGNMGKFGATEGVDPYRVVATHGGSSSGQVGNDFYVDSSGSIFPNPT